MSTEAISVINEQLREMLELPGDSVCADDVAVLIEALETTKRLAQALQQRQISKAVQLNLARKNGARNTNSWLQKTLRISGSDAATRLRVAASTEDGGSVANAVDAGEISLEHADTIGSCLEKLPPQVTDVQRAQAESWLLDEAKRVNPRELRIQGDRLRHSLDPDGALRDEKYHRDHRELSYWTGTDGAFVFSGRCEQECGAVLVAALEPLAKPCPAVDGVTDTRKPARRRMDALAELVDHAVAAGVLPTTGGERPRLVVGTSYEVLAGELDDAGILDATGEALSAAAIRRIACDAEILPMVMGGDSVPLDVGRKQRTAPPMLRAALVQRDGGCAFPGCDRPPGTSEAHHCLEWTRGGETSLSNMVMLCARHHVLLHEERWQSRIDDRGRPEFVPPSTVGGGGTPMSSDGCRDGPPATLKDTG